jgi:transposase
MKVVSAFARLVTSYAMLLDPKHTTGRPRSLDYKEAVERMIWLARTGAQWREIGATVYFTTVFRRMKHWIELGVFEKAYTQLLRVHKKLNPTKHYCIDSSYVKNAFGRECTGKNHTDRGRQALKLSVVCDQHGIVHGLALDPGNRPDVTLLQSTLRQMLTNVESLPLFADRGYDSRKNRGICAQYHLQDRIFRRKTKTVRRTNAKRITVEHTFAWLDMHRRLIRMYEYTAQKYRAFCIIALGSILSKRLYRNT